MTWCYSVGKPPFFIFFVSFPAPNAPQLFFQFKYVNSTFWWWVTRGVHFVWFTPTFKSYLMPLSGLHHCWINGIYCQELLKSKSLLIIGRLKQKSIFMQGLICLFLFLLYLLHGDECTSIENVVEMTSCWCAMSEAWLSLVLQFTVKFEPRTLLNIASCLMFYWFEDADLVTNLHDWMHLHFNKSSFSGLL